jgi:hypothetical protein
MTKYIANEANLKMMMNLLRDKSKNIQFEAFHVFKVRVMSRPLRHLISSQVFVANPKKPPQIETILRRNKDKLLVFLKSFHNDKEGASIPSPTCTLAEMLCCPQTNSSATRSSSSSYRSKGSDSAGRAQCTLRPAPAWIHL